jgi:hypothetical protein
MLLGQGILAVTTLPLLVVVPVTGSHSRNEFCTLLCASALCWLAYSKLRVLPCAQLCIMPISVSLKDFSAALPFLAKVFHSLDHEGMLCFHFTHIGVGPGSHMSTSCALLTFYLWREGSMPSLSHNTAKPMLPAL